MGHKKIKQERRIARVIEPEIYLDTSSVRSAGFRLSQINRHGRAGTSVYTISELINGLRANQESFDRRRGALRNMIDSRLNIDWRSEDTVLLLAFDLTQKQAIYHSSLFQRQVELPIKLIIDVALRADDLIDFNRQIVELNLLDVLVSVEERDNGISKRWIEVFSEGNRVLKKKIDEANLATAQPVSDLPVHRNTKEFSQWMLTEKKWINKYGTLYALSHRVGILLQKLNILKDQMDWRIICDTYNFSLDVLCEAMGKYQMSKVATMGEPGRNDGSDVTHFFYLRPDMILLTEDGLQRRLAESCGIKCFSVREFLARSGTSKK